LPLPVMPTTTPWVTRWWGGSAKGAGEPPSRARLVPSASERRYGAPAAEPGRAPAVQAAPGSGSASPADDDSPFVTRAAAAARRRTKATPAPSPSAWRSAPSAGAPVMKLRDPLKAYLASAPDRVTRGGLLCAHVDGFDLHGRVAFGAHQRSRITQRVRYCARPPLANGRFKELPSGHDLLTLKGPWRDGTTHLKFEPIELQRRPLVWTASGSVFSPDSASCVLSVTSVQFRAPP
jgi:Putative transposase